MDKAVFLNILRSFCIDIDEKQLELLFELMHLTLKKNEIMNLTSITDNDEFLSKMILDSALSLNDINLDDVNNVIDVGSGGGFPGLVLAIIYPNINFTLLDATKKKCDHIREVAFQLGLNNVSVVNERAEIYGASNREKFDLVVARAVSYLNILLELCIPFIKVKGIFIALKGKIADDELEHSKNALEKLHCKLINQYNYELLNENGNRTNFHFLKLKETSKNYPRSYNVIKKKPL